MPSLPSYSEEYERIRAMHEKFPLFVSKDHIWNELVPGTLQIFVAITATFFLLDFLIPSASNKQVPRSYKSAYIGTNFVVNSVLGILGTYHFLFSLESDISDTESIVAGHQELYWLACGQLGYNLWAVPVGLLFAGEKLQMLLHHAAVIVCSAQVGFFRLTLRYFSPFMFGILEISSVPLAIMNAFKHSPELQQRYPLMNQITRIVFAITFLVVRWCMYLPLKYDYLRLLGMVTWSMPVVWVKAYFGLVWIASAFLCVLQLLWGFLIIRGVVKMMFRKSSSGNKKKKKKKES